MKILTKVVVGSRLHGLETPKSDWDYRGVHINSLKDTLSPFKRVKNTSWIEGDEDNTSYELADFCKNATKGNATILEVFFSDQVIETSPVAEEMRKNWKKFMDTNHFINASRGYAHNQLNKMNLFEPDARTPKFAVAYLRVLWQCAKFLETGEFHCKIDSKDVGIDLYEVKNAWRDDMAPELSEHFVRMQARITMAHKKAEILTPDIKWIEEFIYDSYTTASNSL